MQAIIMLDQELLKILRLLGAPHMQSIKMLPIVNPISINMVEKPKDRAMSNTELQICRVEQRTKCIHLSEQSGLIQFNNLDT
jgi:hypothetical protein